MSSRLWIRWVSPDWTSDFLLGAGEAMLEGLGQDLPAALALGSRASYLLVR